MKLLPGEQTLLSSDDDRLLLTTHRVRYHAKIRGFDRFTSIMLEQVSACQIIYISRPWLLTVAVLSIIAGVVFDRATSEASTLIGSLVAIVAILMYAGTRQQVISLRSSGGSIDVPTRGMGMEKAKEFIDALEDAVDRRSQQLQRAARA